MYQMVRHPVKTWNELPDSMGSTPMERLGFMGGMAGGTKGLNIAGGYLSKSVGNNYVKIGSREIPYNKVFGEIMSKNKEEIINKFENAIKDGSYEGVHTTSTKFKEFGKEGKRIEDKGVFIAEWGGANKKWLGISKDVEYKFSLNPLKGFGKSPNIIRIRFKELKELPKGVVNKGKEIYKNSGREKAYEYINKWYEDYAKKNTAYIPFRTEMFETPETQVVIPFKYDVKLKRKGNILQRMKGSKEYVKVDGRNVPIRDFESYLPENEIKINSKEKVREKGSKKDIIELEDINKKYENYLSSEGKVSKHLTPYEIRRLPSSYKKIISSREGKSISSLTKSSTGKSTGTSTEESVGSSTGKSTGTSTGKSIGSSVNYRYSKTVMTKIPKVIASKRITKKESIENMIKAWQPIFLTKDNRVMTGKYYETYKDGASEGVITGTNNNNIKKFMLRPVVVKKELVKKGRSTNLGYNFIQQGNIFVKKNKNNNNSNSGGWMKMIQRTY